MSFLHSLQTKRLSHRSTNTSCSSFFFFFSAKANFGNGLLWVLPVLAFVAFDQLQPYRYPDEALRMKKLGSKNMSVWLSIKECVKLFIPMVMFGWIVGLSKIRCKLSLLSKLETIVHGWRTTGNLGRSNEFKRAMTKLGGWTKRLWNMSVVSSIRDVSVVQSVVLATNGGAWSQNKTLKKGDTSHICGHLYAFKRINLGNDCGWRTKIHFKDHLLITGCLKTLL